MYRWFVQRGTAVVPDSESKQERRRRRRHEHQDTMHQVLARPSKHLRSCTRASSPLNPVQNIHHNLRDTPRAIRGTKECNKKTQQNNIDTNTNTNTTKITSIPTQHRHQHQHQQNHYHEHTASCRHTELAHSLGRGSSCFPAPPPTPRRPGRR